VGRKVYVFLQPEMVVMLPPKKVVFMKTSEKLQKAFEKWQSIQPLTEANKKRLSRRFTVDFNYNSNHIEGNTLTIR
jgi:hypothetical protein